MSDTIKTSKQTFSPRSLAIGLVLGFLAGGAGMYVAGHPPHGPEQPLASEERAARPQYHCPMHPTITSDRPGKCPICGMDLVPIASDPIAGSDAGGQSGRAEGITSSTSQEDHAGHGAPSGSSRGERRIAFYRSPMDPKITSLTPAKDEMGMDFVAVYEDELNGGASAVVGMAPLTIDPQRQQLIGLRLAEVTEGPIASGFKTSGVIAADETRVRKVNVKVQGFVERLFVDFVGKPVTRGQPLFALYSPELFSVQSEYLLALKTKKDLGSRSLADVGEDLVASARERLELWDIPKAEIERLERTGKPSRTVTLVSPIAGVVTAKDVVQGSSLNPGDTPFEITDLSRVWVLADVYESELSRIERGTPARFTAKAFPDRTFEGKVSFLDPQLDPKTRTVRVRIELPNPKGDLRPEMFGEVQLLTGERKVTRVPVDTVIDSGGRKVVFVALGEGKFAPREVTLGVSDGDMVEVKSGLEAGGKVVSRANFLIDSESRLKSALASLGGN